MTTDPLVVPHKEPYWLWTEQQWRQNFNLWVHVCERSGVKWWDWT